MNQAIIDKADSYAFLGKQLFTILRSVSGLEIFMGDSNFVSLMVQLKNSTRSLSMVHPLAPVAVSLLMLPFPLQLDLSPSVISSLLRHSFTDLSYNRLTSRTFPLFKNKTIKTRPFVFKLINDKEFRHSLFPLKKHPGASLKPNVRLGGLVLEMVRGFGSDPVGRLLISLQQRVTEDQAVSALLFAAGIEPSLSKMAWPVASAFILEPKNAKALSTCLKALGLNSTPLGAQLVEGDTLQGRMVGELDLQEQAAQRCDPDYMDKNLLRCNMDDLRGHVRHVISHELQGRDVNMPSIDDYWSSRWIWCVNGSETAASDRALGIDTRGLKDTHSRVYRRIASEMCETEPITGWDANTYVSASQKLENGKTRAIFACDTRSYFAFSWILNATQTAWRNSRVILDPGQGGHLGIVNRIQRAQVGGGVNLMLDYDDFNSAHTNDAMKIVFEELCSIVGAPEWYSNMLSSSFDQTYIKVGGDMKRVLGTLMSGHRGTTFINSILNAAYIRGAVGPSIYDELISLHTGDDVFIRANTLDDCALILERTKLYGCRMNPTKQSVGFSSAEFLRMSIRQTHAYGYLCRAISTIACGNWSTEAELGTRELLSTLLITTRSLMNRSGQQAYPALIASSVRYNLCGRKRLIQLLRGDIALEGQPVWSQDGLIRNVTVTNPTPRPPEFVKTTWSRYATRDYLSQHASSVEVEAISKVSVNIQDLLVASSYSKGLIQDIPGQKDMLVLKPKLPKRATGYAVATQLLQRKLDQGLLTRYPLIRLIETQLTNDDLRDLVDMVGGNGRVQDIREAAFGPETQSHNMVGVYSYADAASLSKLTTSDNILTTTYVHV